MRAHDSVITSVVNALVLYDEAVAGITKVTESVFYIRADGKPIYARTLSLGGATAYVSRPMPIAAPEEIGALFDRIAGTDELTSVLRLLRHSFELESEDRFQAFLASWLTLEVFVGKTFRLYEEALFGDARAGSESKAAARYWNRIKEVMRDKYRFADRFAAIAFQLDPEMAEADLAEIGQLKDLRDGIVHHGNPVRPRDLPLEATRRLARKYLILHLAATGPG